jgi:hypothetical protein
MLFSSHGTGMGGLHTIGKIIITVYPNDHQPAHFHAIHPDFELQIEIETLMIMRGRPSPVARRAVMDWAEANIETIKTEWNRINPRYPAK